MIYVYDIETLINCVTVTFVPVRKSTSRGLSHGSHVTRTFVIHELVNELGALVAFLNHHPDGPTELIGYNCVRFDSYILAHLIVQEAKGKSAAEVVMSTYSLAQEIITEEVKTKRIGYNLPQTDVFLIHHFDNAARATSLKWIECHLEMANIQEMPHPHDKPVRTLDEIYKIVEYNVNDCEATLKLWQHPRTQELIAIRQWAASKYSFDAMLNMSNATMGEAIFKLELEKKQYPLPMPLSPREFYLKEIILPKIRFKTPEFQKVLEQIREHKITPGDASDLDIKPNHDGIEYQFALGGLHAAREEQIFEDVYSIDVKSYYPNLAIQNNLCPRHLSQEVFVETYRMLYAQRISLPPGPANKALKESLVSIFGKSNSEYSFLYDPQFTYGITINGQLFLAMLCEAIVTRKAGRIIMANTDGLEIKVSNVDEFNKICRAWESYTGLTLESDFYKKIMIRDVNNYIAVNLSGKLKTKGAYEIEKEFHKDPSARIVPVMVSRWFTGTADARDIMAIMKTYGASYFLLFARAKTGKFVGVTPKGGKFDLPKTIRYFISKKGFTLVRATDKRIDRIHKGVFICMVNNYDDCDPPASEYPNLIDYRWYYKEIQKLIIRPKPKGIWD